MVNNSDKIAIFDFCETLVGFQSADAYIRYVIEKENLPQPKFSLLDLLWNKLSFRLFGIGWNKLVLLKGIKDLPECDLEEYAYQFYLQKIKPALIHESVDYLKWLKSQGYYIIIASAGFDIYIKYFAKEVNADKIICSEIEFKDGKCKGKLAGYDLIGRKKTKRLKCLLGKSTLKDCDSIAVSDSRSDWPLLNYCKKAVVVCKNKPDWIRKDMEVLIWKC